MAAAKKPSKRDPWDAYYTDPRLAAAALGWVADRSSPGWAPTVFVEPCAGAGAFTDAAKARWPGLYAIGCDPDPRAPAAKREDLEVYVGRLEDPAFIERASSFRKERVLIATNPHYKDYPKTVRILRDIQRTLTLAGSPAVLLLLLRETALSHLTCGDDPPTDIGLTPIRPTWGGPGGEALLAEARRKAEEETRPKREAKAADYRARAAALERQRLSRGRSEPTQEELRLLASAERALQPPTVSAPSADSCGSALALWRPPIPGRDWGRQWHPIPPWRDVGGDHEEE